ncbi:MAG: hypothetical protein K0U66_00740, partial [Gammaproteobacteria bacterium]|nr:hypothetical protein [Gammaproteobacteria bacterium]
MVSIAVVSGVAAFAVPGLLTYTVGTDIGSQVFTNTNTGPDTAAISDCMASTTLPAGLIIAAQSETDNGCVLTGNPMTPTDADFYSIAVTNSNGVSTLTLNIVVNPAAPDLQAPTAQIFATGADVALTLTNDGGGLLSAISAMPPGCAADKDLPVGLGLAVSADGNSCTISGQPSVAVAADDYIVTATNASGGSSATVNIEVVLGTPTLAAPTALSLPADVAVTDVDIDNTNSHANAGRVTACSAVAPLPTGLTIAAQDAPGNGCVLSGRPVAFTAQAAYAVTVTNDNGMVTLMLDITVVRQTYTLAFTSGSVTRTVGDAAFTTLYSASPDVGTDAVIWTSSDPDVATVDSATGEVTIVAIGTTT